MSLTNSLKSLMEWCHVRNFSSCVILTSSYIQVFISPTRKVCVCHFYFLKIAICKNFFPCMYYTPKTTKDGIFYSKSAALTMHLIWFAASLVAYKIYCATWYILTIQSMKINYVRVAATLQTWQYASSS